MNTMNYKGYAARIEFDERDDIFIRNRHPASSCCGCSQRSTRQRYELRRLQAKVIKEAAQA